VRPRQDGTRHPALQNRNTLSIETGARGSDPAYNYMDVIREGEKQATCQSR
jgi:hypothetical protein